MPRTHRTPRKQPVVPEIPFASTTEAWFWYIRAERLRRDGAKLSGKAPLMARPCEPDDINRVVMALFRKKTLKSDHLKVLATFGWNDRTPDPRVGAEIQAAYLWEEAINRLDAELKTKGIVE